MEVTGFKIMIVVVEVSVGRERQNVYALRLHMDEWQAIVCPRTDSGDKDRDGDFRDVLFLPRQIFIKFSFT